MKWLTRLKKIEVTPKQEATEPTKPSFVGFVAPILTPIQKTGVEQTAENDPANQVQVFALDHVHDKVRIEVPTENDQTAVIDNLDRWCWPHSIAMTGAEIDTFTARLARFTGKGLSLDDGEALADILVKRDRESDDRRLCLECLHLAGHAAGSWGCRNWQRAEVANNSRDARLPAELVRTLQWCDGFNNQLQTGGQHG